MKNKLTREMFLYILFGGCTTFINIVIYSLLYYGIKTSNTAANAIGWILSVTFAYVTNRKWVFESKSSRILREAVSFFCCRAITGAAEIILMYLLVDIACLEGGIVKIFLNVAVIVANYIFSRLIVFVKKQK